MPHNFPYGDAFLVETPAIDKMEERLYNQERERQLLRQKDAEALDQQFSKNVAAIRDVDVDDFTNAYNDWKQSNQLLMRSKNLSGADYGKAQLQVQKKLADVYKLANASKQQREKEEDLAKRYMMKPDDFNDNATNLLITARNTPIGRLQTFQVKDEKGEPVVMDLTNAENYLYRDKTNWQPILQKAAGTLEPRGMATEEPTPDGMQRKVTSYKAMNDPLRYYNSILGAFSTPRADSSLAKRYPFTPEEAATITDEFEKYRNTPEFKNIYGDVRFPESSGLSAGAKTAKLLAMQHVLQNKPVAVVSYKPNTDEATKRKENFVREMTGTRFENSKELIRLNNMYRDLRDDKKAEEQAAGLEAFIDSQIQEANKNPIHLWNPSTGVSTDEGDTKASPLILSAFSERDNAGNINTVSKITALKDGTFRIKGPNIDKVISRDEYRVGLGNKIFNTKTKIAQTTPPKKQGAAPTKPSTTTSKPKVKKDPLGLF